MGHQRKINETANPLAASYADRATFPSLQVALTRTFMVSRYAVLSSTQSKELTAHALRARFILPWADPTSNTARFPTHPVIEITSDTDTTAKSGTSHTADESLVHLKKKSVLKFWHGGGEITCIRAFRLPQRCWDLLGCYSAWSGNVSCFTTTSKPTLLP
jgi:hypothetical protein